MKSSRVLILYNEPILPVGHPDYDSEADILGTVEAVHEALRMAGVAAERLGLGRDPAALLAGLSEHRPEVIFNLFEGTPGQAHSEAYVAGLLEWLGLSFTGSPARALYLAQTKHLAKQLLRGAGLPTPDFQVVERLPLAEWQGAWPAIVKPALQDASVGIDHASVVTKPAQLTDRVAYLLKQFGPPVLIEQFIDGREFNISLIERPDLQVLPIDEILFQYCEPGCWPIVTYDAKWSPESADYKATPPHYPAEVSSKLKADLQSLAQQAFRLIGCRDYARVDFRVSRDERPYIIEVNPNPAFNPNAGFAFALGASGVPHAQFVEDLVRAALQRAQGPELPPLRIGEQPTARAKKKRQTTAQRPRAARSRLKARGE
jgi:D-alanine-D-alanine ligase